MCNSKLIIDMFCPAIVIALAFYPALLILSNKVSICFHLVRCSALVGVLSLPYRSTPMRYGTSGGWLPRRCHAAKFRIRRFCRVNIRISLHGEAKGIHTHKHTGGRLLSAKPLINHGLQYTHYIYCHLSSLNLLAEIDASLDLNNPLQIYADLLSKRPSMPPCRQVRAALLFLYCLAL